MKFFRLPGTFRLLMILAVLLMIAGHVALHSHPLGHEGNVFDPRRSFVSEYAGHWPLGWWIKASMICYGLAVVWFCRQAVATLAKGRWVLPAKMFWMAVGLLMGVGLLLVMLFDVVPPEPVPFLDQLWNQYVARSAPSPPNGLAEHGAGFYLFVQGSFLAYLALMGREMITRRWGDLATSIVLFSSMLVSYHLLGVMKDFPGIPQRALLFAAACLLYRGGVSLRQDERCGL